MVIRDDKEEQVLKALSIELELAVGCGEVLVLALFPPRMFRS